MEDDISAASYAATTDTSVMASRFILLLLSSELCFSSSPETSARKCSGSQLPFSGAGGAPQSFSIAQQDGRMGLERYEGNTIVSDLAMGPKFA